MQRSSTLRKGCLEAVDEAIAGCSVDEFVAGFSGLPEAQRGALAKVLQSVQAELQGLRVVRGLTKKHQGPLGPTMGLPSFRSMRLSPFQSMGPSPFQHGQNPVFQH